MKAIKQQNCKITDYWLEKVGSINKDYHLLCIIDFTRRLSRKIVIVSWTFNFRGEFLNNISKYSNCLNIT